MARDAVARQSADTMFVEDIAGAPIDALANRQHRFRQGDGLVEVEAIPRARRDERRQFEIGEIAGQCIADN